MEESNKVRYLSETYAALEKAKLYHYKEIVKNLMEIKTQMSLVRFNFQKIEEFNRKQRLSAEEQKRYSYVTQQIEKFGKPQSQEVVKRLSGRSRHNSDNSSVIESLHVWEDYLVQKEKSESMPNLSSLSIDVPKRSHLSNRKNKKFVSSTFNDILEDQNVVDHERENINVIEEDEFSDTSSVASYRTADDLDDFYQEDSNEKDLNSHTDENLNDLSDYKKVDAKNYSLTNILENLQEFIEEEESTKPKIVDVIVSHYKYRWRIFVILYRHL